MKYLLKNQESERLLFREVNLSDFSDWLAFHEDPNTALYWNATLESPEKECKKWYDKQVYRYKNNLGGMNALLDKTSGKLIGHCGLLVQKIEDKLELEIGYSILPEYWNQGFAIESAKKCRDFAFDHNFSDSLISIISLTNTPSEKVAIKNGMTIDKVTEYNQNTVNIFRITKSEWEKVKSK